MNVPLEVPTHDVVFASLTVTLKLETPQPCDGPKLYALENKRPRILADRVMLGYQRDPEKGWQAITMAVSGTAVDTDITAAILRREWNRSSPELPPSWLAALMRAHRPKETS